MTEPVGTTMSLTAPVLRTVSVAVAANARLAAPRLQISGPQTAIPLALMDPPATSQQMGGGGASGFGPPGFFTPRAATSNPTGVMTTQPIMTAQDMDFLTTPITGDDPATQAMEALHVS